MATGPTLTMAIPQIPAQDVIATAAFYVEKLGFTQAFEHEGYIGMRRDGAEIHIYHYADRSLAENTMYRVSVTNITALCAEFQGRGLQYEIREQPWGSKDLPVIDPAGNCLTFYEVTD